jgi:hypothetical protein
VPCTALHTAWADLSSTFALFFEPIMQKTKEISISGIFETSATVL